MYSIYDLYKNSPVIEFVSMGYRVGLLFQSVLLTVNHNNTVIYSLSR